VSGHQRDLARASLVGNVHARIEDPVIGFYAVALAEEHVVVGPDEFHATDVRSAPDQHTWPFRRTGNGDSVYALAVEQLQRRQQLFISAVVGVEVGSFSGQDHIVAPECERRHRDAVPLMLHVDVM
jgi:hypothetical protein